MSTERENFNYVDYLARLYNDPMIHYKAKEITFQITSSCNLKCSYCYEHHKRKEVMSLDTGKKIVDYLISEWELDDPTHYINKNVRCVIFSFIGGEPFLEVELIDDILEYFLIQCALKHCSLSKGMRVSLSSNGTLYFDPKVQSFLKKYKSFISLTISIDGTKELHDKYRVDYDGNGSFDKAFAAFKANKQWFGQQPTKMTFVPESFPYIYDSIKLMVENDVRYIACNYAYEAQYTEKDASILYEQLKKVSDYLIENKFERYVTILDPSTGRPFDKSQPDHDKNYCGGTGNMLCYTPNGDAYPCLRYCPISVGDEKAKKMKVGDYNGIYNTPESQKLKKELEAVTRTSQSTQKCIDCKIAMGCGWCSAYNYEATGSFNKRVTNICWAHHGRTAAVCYFINKQFLENGGEAPKKVWLDEETALKFLTKEQWNEIKDLEARAFEKAKEMRIENHF